MCRTGNSISMHHDTEYPTIHTNPLLFMPGKAGFESIILNATRQFLRYDVGQFYIGESISAGLFDCKTIRYDWKIGDKEVWGRSTIWMDLSNGHGM